MLSAHAKVWPIMLTKPCASTRWHHNYWTAGGWTSCEPHQKPPSTSNASAINATANVTYDTSNAISDDIVPNVTDSTASADVPDTIYEDTNADAEWNLKLRCALAVQPSICLSSDRPMPPTAATHE